MLAQGLVYYWGHDLHDEETWPKMPNSEKVYVPRHAATNWIVNLFKTPLKMKLFQQADNPKFAVAKTRKSQPNLHVAFKT